MQVWCSFGFFQRPDAETMPGMVSYGRITTDILLCGALHQPRIRDKMPGSEATPSPYLPARDIIAGLKLIDGDAVWGGQRKIRVTDQRMPYGHCRRTIGPQTAMSKEIQGRLSKMRTILTTALIALAITTAAAFGADNTIGTWKLDVAKSKYIPAPMPVKSLTITREASDGGVKVHNHGRTN